MFAGFLKKPLGITVAIIVIIAGISYWYFSAVEDREFFTSEAVRGDLEQVVSVTGRVKPVQSVDLAFEKSGRVADVRALVGQRA